MPAPSARSAIFNDSISTLNFNKSLTGECHMRKSCITRTDRRSIHADRRRIRSIVIGGFRPDPGPDAGSADTRARAALRPAPPAKVRVHPGRHGLQLPVRRLRQRQLQPSRLRIQRTPELRFPRQHGARQYGEDHDRPRSRAGRLSPGRGLRTDLRRDPLHRPRARRPSSTSSRPT